MRRCHSEAMQDYRRQHNQEMWERELPPVVVPSREDLALRNLRVRLEQAAKVFVEEAGIGE